MKFTTISDVHIKNPNDCPNHSLFMTFLNSKHVNDSDKIFLLGDIFDIMVGNFKEYRKYYKEIFSKLAQLSNAGKSIYFVEGNHDYHIVKMLNDFAKDNYLKNFHAFSTEFLLRDEENKKTIYLGHGDEIEIENLSYKILRFVVRSNLFKLIVNNCLSFNFVINLGNKLSNKSRSRNEKMYDKSFSNEIIKEKFRRSSELTYFKNNFDLIICGHSHVKDEYSSNNKFTYLNNGYFPVEKQYVFYNNGVTTFEKV